MDRKEFLTIAGTLLLAITGILGIAEKVKHISGSPSKSSNKFSSGPYGI